MAPLSLSSGESYEVSGLAIIINHKKRHYLLTLTNLLLYVVYSVWMFITFLSPFHLLGTDKACEIDLTKSVGPD